MDYDPLISKLAAWGSTREEAIERMRRALNEYHIGGIRTNIAFFLEILVQEDFRKGDFDTGFIDRWLRNRNGSSRLSDVHRDLAGLTAALFHSQSSPAPSETPRKTENPWKLSGRRNALRKR
jgi:acetyl-CoA carboxylase biotin carboxylase subunit